MSERSTPFHQIRDVMFEIFSFSLAPSVFFKYSLVCKCWNDLISSDNYFKQHRTLTAPKKSSNQENQSSPPSSTFLNDTFTCWIEYMSYLNSELYESLLSFRKHIKSVKKGSEYFSRTEITFEFYENDEQREYTFTCEKSNRRNQVSILAQVFKSEDELKRRTVTSIDECELVPNNYVSSNESLETPVNKIEVIGYFVQMQNGKSIERRSYFSFMKWFLSFRERYFPCLSNVMFLMALEFIIDCDLPHYSHLNPRDTVLLHAYFENFKYQANNDECNLVLKSIHLYQKDVKGYESLWAPLLKNLNSSSWTRLEKLIRNGYSYPLKGLRDICLNFPYDQKKCQFLRLYLNWNKDISLKDLCQDEKNKQEFSLQIQHNYCKAFCETLVENCLDIVKETSSYLLYILNDDGEVNYELLDYLKEKIPNFYSPCDLRLSTKSQLCSNDLERIRHSSTAKCILFCENENQKKEMERDFSEYKGGKFSMTIETIDTAFAISQEEHQHTENTSMIEKEEILSNNLKEKYGHYSTFFFYEQRTLLYNHNECRYELTLGCVNKLKVLLSCMQGKRFCVIMLPFFSKSVNTKPLEREFTKLREYQVYLLVSHHFDLPTHFPIFEELAC
ncbi:hypothetical protein C9374_004113 [Naegleria lovaniensis]|uniref:F-box domain-containing protein n=1 Tax=Naegleria lovaniensis TaxID=51637 RepID=A0AA88GRW4_NAELO|nr:uncharacterized protein C9374_004113 [Naegleria lovaniensis]KAG2383442.1 hypothetical protein C9374_004113 [Naegleria lovaniensis]